MTAQVYVLVYSWRKLTLTLFFSFQFFDFFVKEYRQNRS